MDILNFISWIKGGRIVTSVDSSKTLLPVGLKDNRRDDKYLAGAISVQDLVTQITPEPAYKVYTALLTQNGVDNPLSISTGLLTIGVTYVINDTVIDMDFTNVGAPNNNVGTYFVATGTNPNWGTNPLELAILNYNTGAPVATVLENTIGNIWFSYQGNGIYSIYSNGLFTIDKTWVFSASVFDPSTASIEPVFIDIAGEGGSDLPNILNIRLTGGDFGGDSLLNKTPIEIRVYN